MENTMAQVLNIQAALDMLGGDKPLLKELLISFIKDTVFDEQKLLDLEKLPDTQEAGKYVHLFKGAGRQLGAERLGESGQALENVLRKKESGDITALTRKFVSDYTLTLAAVKDTLMLSISHLLSRVPSQYLPPQWIKRRLLPNCLPKQ